MDRLTEHMNDELDGVFVKEHDYIGAAHRLAEYEDTGLTPEEINAILNNKWNKEEVWEAISTISSWRSRYNLFKGRRQYWKHHVCGMAIQALREVIGEPICK